MMEIEAYIFVTLFLCAGSFVAGMIVAAILEKKWLEDLVQPEHARTEEK